MLKRKTSSNGYDRSATCTWTFTMEDAWIDSYLHPQTIGNRIGGIFTTHVVENRAIELKGKFSDKLID